MIEILKPTLDVLTSVIWGSKSHASEILIKRGFSAVVQSVLRSDDNVVIQAIHIQVPVGIPLPDGGLEIPNRIFLGGIPIDTTEQELEMFFSEYGVVSDVRIVTDRKTGACKGYGFVTFEEEEDIRKLLEKKSIIMKGKRLRVRKAVRRNGSQFDSDDESQSSLSPKSSSSGSVGSVEPITMVSPEMATPPSPEPEVMFVPSEHVNVPQGNGYIPATQPSQYVVPCSPPQFIPPSPQMEGKCGTTMQQAKHFGQMMGEYYPVPSDRYYFVPFEQSQSLVRSCGMPMQCTGFNQNIPMYQPKVCYVSAGHFPVNYGAYQL